MDGNKYQFGMEWEQEENEQQQEVHDKNIYTYKILWIARLVGGALQEIHYLSD